MFKKLFRQKQPETESLDAGTIAALRAHAADMAQPRDVVHYLYFGSQEYAESAAAQVRAFGLNVTVRPAATGSQWLALANHDLVVTEQSIANERRELEKICATFGGDYDGWEAAAS